MQREESGSEKDRVDNRESAQDEAEAEDNEAADPKSTKENRKEKAEYENKKNRIESRFVGCCIVHATASAAEWHKSGAERETVGGNKKEERDEEEPARLTSDMMCTQKRLDDCLGHIEHLC